MKHFFFLLLLLLVLIMNSCVPPIRSITGRMPESTGAPGSGSIDVGTAYMVPVYDNTNPLMFLLEPQLVVAVTPKLNLDFNLTMYNIGTDHFSDSYLGSIGAHYMLAQRKRLKCSIGGGAMLGATYVRNDDDDDDENYDYTSPGSWSFAAGGFFQLDYGVRFNKHVGMYFGNNFSFIFVDNWPAAFYGVHSIGFQFNWNKNFYSSVEVGLAWSLFGSGNRYPVSFGPAITLLGYNW